MATRTISATGGTRNYTDTATWEGGVVPTSADDIVARSDGTSGNLIFNTGTMACRSADFTNYVGTISRTGGNWNIGHSTAPPGGIALKLVSGMVYSMVGALTFVTTHTTAQTVTFAGKTLNGTVTISGAGAVIHFADTISTSTTVTISGNASTVLKFLAGGVIGANLALSFGKLEVNGQTISLAALQITNNSSVRILDLGTGGILNTTGVDSAGSVVNFSVTGSGTISVGGNNNSASLRGVDWSGTANGITFAFIGAGTATIKFGTGTGTAVGTVGNLTRIGTAVKTDSFIIDGNITINGNLTINGEGTTGNRVLTRTLTRGVNKTITCNGTVSISHTDFRDITGAGSASWNLSASTAIGDAQGNSGITCNPSVIQTYDGSGSNASVASAWTSRIPLPQDDVLIPVSNGITLDMPRFGKNVDFTGSNGAANLSSTEIHGNLILAIGMTINGTNTMTLVGRGVQTITSAGCIFSGSVFIDAVDGVGSYSLTDAFINSRTSTSAFLLISGSFDANDFNVTFTGALGGIVGTSGTLILGNGTWLFTGITGRVFWSIAAAVTIVCELSTIELTPASGNNGMTFAGGAGGGKVYNKLKFTGASTSVLSLTNSVTFKELRSTGGAHEIRITATGTIVLAANGVFELKNGSFLTTNIAGSAATLSAPSSAVIDVDGGSIKDSTASGGATFIAYNSTDVSGNTGWTFEELVTANKDVWGMIPMKA